MASVKLLRSAGGNNIGDEINVGKGQAEHLINIGYAEAVQPVSKPKRAAKKSAEKSDDTPGDATPGGASQTEDPSTAG